MRCVQLARKAHIARAIEELCAVDGCFCRRFIAVWQAVPYRAGQSKPLSSDRWLPQFICAHMSWGTVSAHVLVC